MERVSRRICMLFLGIVAVLTGPIPVRAQQGSFSTIPNFPGASDTVPFGINNAGQIVGVYYDAGFHSHGFLLTGGSFSSIDFPGASDTVPCGINDTGQIMGLYDDGFTAHGFLLTGGSFSTIDFPGASYTSASGINNAGQIVGTYSDADGAHGFLLDTGGSLLDPVPDLLQGSAVTAVTEDLATKGRVIQGVAADGVTQAVLRIPANSVNERLTLTVLDEGGKTSVPTDEDGALSSISGGTFQNEITISAMSTNEGPIAFAIYRAPIDFPRPNNGFDPLLDRRKVSIKIQSLTTTSTTTLPIVILRPPVALVHGIWDDSSLWNGFSSAFNGLHNNPLWSVGRVDYSFPVGSSIQDSLPTFSPKII